MKIAIVGPSPVPFTFGGVESLLGSLRDQIASLTPHQVELIKLPSRERSFWELVDNYHQFWSLDLGHFDRVISIKYPAWMVRHSYHICYMTHRLRGLYDTYHLTGEPMEVRPGIPHVDRLLQFMERHANSSAEVLPELFHLLDRLREQSEVPQELFKFPGPLIRRIVQFLDDHALAPKRIQHYFAISATVARRPCYFPAGVEIKVVHPPSHLSGFKDTGAEYLFTTSRLDSPKRMDLLVKAMRSVKAPLSLKIAGTGPEEGALWKLAQGNKRIEFLGFIPNEALVELYGGALAVLYVPYEEDYGLVTIEAMMSRKPVITCADSGGPLEFVEEGKTGFIARPDPEDIAEKIEQLATDAETANAMGSKGYERVRGITWERTIKTLLQELTDLSPARSFSRVAKVPTASRKTSSFVTARPKLTVAVPFPIYPPVGGGQQRVFSLYRRVAQAFDVELVSLAEAGSHRFEGEIAPGMREIRIPRSVKHQEEEARVAQDGGGIPIEDIAIPLLLQYTPEYFEYLTRSMEGASLVIASHPYCRPAIMKCLDRQPLVYEAHNVEYRLKEDVLRKAGSWGADLVNVVRETESEICRSSSLILCCSQADQEELRRLYHLESAHFILASNGVDVQAVRFVSQAERNNLKSEFGLQGQHIVLFVGSWHPPNLEAAETIFKIAGELPRVNFLLVGSQCLPLADRPRPRNVGLMGVVDEETLAILLALADIALNPMLGGSGTNLKMATYLAAGVPVITTPHGARGYELISGEHALICPVEEFPGKIAQVLTNRGLAEGLARRGRHLVEERYDWSRIGADVVTALWSLLSLPTQGGEMFGNLIDQVSSELADLGTSEDNALVRCTAEVLAELSPRTASSG